ncbi:vitamin K epoxide reductase family protein [Legionella cardiaca]|uniref:Vitamin K epoxide reductase family protein n=1 Tax=Legionella cardiaca TaxID=1071983 RepID=A0ABY8AN38_9GAMM|nr:vitamin K epoxide reductase family protein [Legionella cardiaca]WED42062.1 vitamin K epoxide reductase family protein [Legionella cardiaca]
MAKRVSKPVVIITGAAGKIGMALTRALRNTYKVIGFDIDNCEIPCDITSANSVALAFKLFKEKYGSKITAVIHLAAYFDFTGNESPLYKSVNVDGTKKLLVALQDFDVERFIYSSTILVHKPCPLGETIHEDYPLKPKWAYPKSKAKAEETIASYHGKVPYLILRLAGLYDDVTCVPTLANQIARVYERDMKSHLYAGNVKAGQSFIHQKDLIKVFKKALLYRNKLAEEEIIIAGEPKTISYEKLQHQITQLIHSEKSTLYTVPSPIAKAGAWVEQHAEPLIPDDFDQGEKPFIRSFMVDLASDHYALDVSKAKKILHWEPKHTIEETLPKIIEALKADPENWYEKNGIIKPDWMVAAKESPEKIRLLYESNFRKQHQQNLWAHFLNIAFGFWLITSPVTLGYLSYPLMLSDILSGTVLIFLAFLSLSWRLAPARWGCAVVGLWLLFAPLIFWAPTAAAYLNDTLIGSLVIGFSVLVRPDIGVAPNALEGPSIPPGWEYSPSSWIQRLPIIILAFIGFYISRYMAAYQLGHIEHVWDPFFIGYLPDAKNGTEEIITSYVSKAFPVPDAGLGAAVYILEILTGIIGGSNRWRTMPWLVLLFGIMIVPLGVVSIAFIIIQPILLNTWCTLCLIAAVAMLIQVPYSFDELIATSVFLWRRWKAGRPILRILFVGDSDNITKATKEEETYPFEQSPRIILRDMLSGGITLPWNLMFCLLIGLWLMFTRITLGTEGSMANADHLIGSLIVTITITALAETVRVLRLLNLFFALALIITPFIYEATTLATIMSIICGGGLFILSLPRGTIRSSYGAWDKIIL